MPPRNGRGDTFFQWVLFALLWKSRLDFLIGIEFLRISVLLRVHFEDFIVMKFWCFA